MQEKSTMKGRNSVSIGIKPGASMKYDWHLMGLGDTFIAEKPVAYAGNAWAERNDLDRKFAYTKLEHRKYEIKRIK